MPLEGEWPGLWCWLIPWRNFRCSASRCRSSSSVILGFVNLPGLTDSARSIFSICLTVLVDAAFSVCLTIFVGSTCSVTIFFDSNDQRIIEAHKEASMIAHDTNPAFEPEGKPPIAPLVPNPDGARTATRWRPERRCELKQTTKESEVI